MAIDIKNVSFKYNEFSEKKNNRRYKYRIR